MRRNRGTQPPCGSTEEGSLLLALLAVLVIGGLVAVLMASTVTGQRQVQFDRSFSNAINPADSGIDAATTWINSREADGGVAADPAVDYTESGSIDSGGDQTFTWTATKVNDQLWEIVSVGTAPDGTTRTVEASIVPQPLFQFAAFAKTQVGLGGGNSADSYDPHEDDDPEAPELDTGRGIIGSNGTIIIDNNSTANNTDGVELHDFGEGDTLENRLPGNCGNCDDFRVFVEDGGKLFGVFEKPLVFDTWWIERTMSTLVDSRPGSTYQGDACNEALSGMSSFDHVTDLPDALDFRDDRIIVTVNGTTEEFVTAGIPGGAYCAHEVLFTGATGDNIDPIASEDAAKNADGDSREDVIVYTDGPVDIESQLNLNCQNPGFTCSQGWPLSSDLQIFSSGASVAISNQANVAGLIYAPQASCEGPTSNASADIFGAIVCDSMSNVGGWAFHFDESSREITTQEYVLDEWREEPTGSSF